VLARTSLPARHMHRRNEVASQKRSQPIGIQPVGLDLRLGNQSGLVRVGHTDRFNLFDTLEPIVDRLTVPACLNHHPALAAQRAKKLSETSSQIALDAGFPQPPASTLLRNTNTVAFVDI